MFVMKIQKNVDSSVLVKIAWSSSNVHIETTMSFIKAKTNLTAHLTLLGWLITNRKNVSSDLAFFFLNEEIYTSRKLNWDMPNSWRSL